MSEEKMRAIHWFRKGLRLHDNPALAYAAEHSEVVYPVFIMDSSLMKLLRSGPNRWRFLRQSLEDLDHSFKKFGNRLFVARGTPDAVLAELVKKWKINLLTHEIDTEPYARKRDASVSAVMSKLKVKVVAKLSHTLYDPEQVLAFSASGKTPFTYQGFLSTIKRIGPPPRPVADVDLSKVAPPESELQDRSFDNFTLEEVGHDESQAGPCLYPGGETEALLRLDRSLSNPDWVCRFAKPDTSPNSLEPSTTVLSPYVKFGCLSSRKFYHDLQAVYREKKKHTDPPVSLEGQLLWREFFYANAASTVNFDRMVGNPICRQVAWDTNPKYLEAWKTGKTGYPFIDAIMIKLKTEGWIHHLARHAVACFLTRGDLWISWEQGKDVFEEYLLDADWSLNAGNWMWLSASAFFHQYFRVYSPISFGKKTDPNGDFIRKYIPVLSRFPREYIYEPWKAPKAVQERCKCMIGVDYPKPIVDHDVVRKRNLQRMAAAYKQNTTDAATDEEGDVLVSPKKKKMKK